MKQTILALLITVTLFACKKEVTTSATPEHEKQAYRVLVIGKGDTTTSTVMFARTETVGLATADDSKLHVDLIGYQKVNGQGVYTLSVTNKQDCRVLIRWGWEELLVSDITPADDQVNANSTRVFVVTGEAKVGKIKLKAEGECGNSSTLIINITNDILPIKLVDNTAKYDDQTGKTTISFELEEPQLAEWILVQHLNDAKAWEQAALVASDYQTKQYSIKF